MRNLINLIKFLFFMFLYIYRLLIAVTVTCDLLNVTQIGNYYQPISDPSYEKKNIFTVFYLFIFYTNSEHTIGIHPYIIIFII